MTNAEQKGRDYLAAHAERKGELMFAREVREGMWDHRRDVSACIRAALTGADMPALAGK
jgi:hypothetical protein